MADKDLTGLTEFMDVWLPTKIRESVEPVVTRAEQTIHELNSIINAKIRNALIPLVVSNKSLNQKILNTLDEKLASSEAKVDRLNRDVFDKIETRLAPLETSLSFLPSSGRGALQNIESSSIGLGQIYNLPSGQAINPPAYSGGTSLVEPGGTLINIPELIPEPPVCPPQQIINEPCPPVEPCPPCPQPPDDPCNFSLFSRYCQIPGQSSCYLVQTGFPPIDPRDTFIESIQDSQGGPLCRELEKCNEVAYTTLPLCQELGGPCKPLPIQIPPGCCPPAQIQNIINPPLSTIQQPTIPLPQGTIQNIINPPQTIINVPPITTIGQPSIPIGGQSQNVPKQQQGQCFPEGDMAYYSLECNDDSKIKQLSNEILGASIASYFGDKTVMQWWNDITKDKKSTAIPVIEGTEGVISNA